MKDEPNTTGTDTPTPTTPLDLATIRGRVQAVIDDDMPVPFSVEVGGGLITISDADGQFVADDLELPAATLLAHAPEDLLSLCDEVERLRAAKGDAPK